MGTRTTTTRHIEYLKTKPWNSKEFSVPQIVFSIPGMLSNEEKRMLYYLTLSDYSGKGVIADLGSFLGGSTICFAAALRQRSFDKPMIHSYDLFKVDPNPQSVQRRYFAEENGEHIRMRDIFEDHLRDYLSLITVYEGDILGFSANQPIEFLFVDIAKSYKVMDHLLLNFFPALLPMKSLIIMQDYLFGSSGPWHHIVMEKLNEYCEYIVDTGINSVVFFLKKKIPQEVLEQCQWMNIPMDEKLQLMDSAIYKLDTPEKKEFLIESRELLLQGKDAFWGMHYHKL
jgi:predicted O-methyltransferase YrrM